MRPIHTMLCCALALLLAACGRSDQSPSAGPAEANGNADWDGFVAGFVEDTLHARPHFAVYQGRHEFDGQLPDFGAAGTSAEIARLHTARDRAAGFDPAKLDAHRRYLREYLLARIDHDLFWLEEAAWPQRNPLFYTDQLDPDVYLNRPYAPLAQRMAAYARYAEAVPAALTQIRAQLRTPLPRTYAELGAAIFGGYGEFTSGQVPAIFAAVEDAELRARFEAANTAAAAAMSELGQ